MVCLSRAGTSWKKGVLQRTTGHLMVTREQRREKDPESK